MPQRTPPCLLLLLAASGCAHRAAHPHHGGHHEGGHDRPGYHHRFEDPARWAAIFDDPERDAWQKPDEVIRALGLRTDAKVADIGAGTGYFAVRIARAVPEGKVYAVDVEPEMVGHLEKRAAEAGLRNVVGVLAAPDDPRLPEAVDLVLVVDTYHHIDQRPAYFGKLKEKLKPGGRLAIIDYRPESERGPPRHAKFTADEVVRELGSAGYRLVDSPGFLPDQYLLILEPAPRESRDHLG